MAVIRRLFVGGDRDANVDHEPRPLSAGARFWARTR